MNKPHRTRALLGAGALALIAIASIATHTTRSPSVVSAEAPSSNAANDVDARREEVVAVTPPNSEAAGIEDATNDSQPVPYAGSNGTTPHYGERIQFTEVTECSDSYVQTTRGDWVPTLDCTPAKLVVDHPYGNYTIAQLEQAANEMNDGDAAYILAERFASETWRDRREDAHAYYLKAFLLTSDSEIYSRMLGEMGLNGSVSTRNGEIDVESLAANYTMFRVGQMFGVVEDAAVDRLAAAVRGADSIDVAALEQQAQGVYESLLEARGGQ